MALQKFGQDFATTLRANLASQSPGGRLLLQQEALAAEEQRRQQRAAMEQAQQQALAGQERQRRQTALSTLGEQFAGGGLSPSQQAVALAGTGLPQFQQAAANIFAEQIETPQSRLKQQQQDRLQRSAELQERLLSSIPGFGGGAGAQGAPQGAPPPQLGAPSPLQQLGAPPLEQIPTGGVVGFEPQQAPPPVQAAPPLQPQAQGIAGASEQQLQGLLLFPETRAFAQDELERRRNAPSAVALSARAEQQAKEGAKRVSKSIERKQAGIEAIQGLRGPLTQLKENLKGVQTGPLTGANIFLNNLGSQLGLNIDLSDSSRLEQIEAAGNQIALSLTGQLKGALSNKELDFIRNAIPNALRSKFANLALSDALTQVVEQADAKQGIIDELTLAGRDNEIPTALRKFERDNPLRAFTPPRALPRNKDGGIDRKKLKDGQLFTQRDNQGRQIVARYNAENNTLIPIE